MADDESARRHEELTAILRANRAWIDEWAPQLCLVPEQPTILAPMLEKEENDDDDDAHGGGRAAVRYAAANPEAEAQGEGEAGTRENTAAEGAVMGEALASALDAVLVEGAMAAEAPAPAPKPACEKCGKKQWKLPNVMLACASCGRHFHMLCVALGHVPSGDWNCEECAPNKRFQPSDEQTMTLEVGTQVWAKDKKAMWAKARVLKHEVIEPVPSPPAADTSGAGAEAAEQAPGAAAAGGGGEAAANGHSEAAAGGGSGAPEGEGGAAKGEGEGAAAEGEGGTAKGEGEGAAAEDGPRARVRVRFVGFSQKFDEWILVGLGRLRPLAEGPPPKGYDAEFYLVRAILDVRKSGGRCEFLTCWEGYDDQTWEPRSSFVGAEARNKLRAFLARARGGGDPAQGMDDEAIAAAAEEEEAEAAAHAKTKKDKDSGWPLDPTPVFRWLPQTVTLPESRSWIYVGSNHPVPDGKTTFVPWLGDDDTDFVRSPPGPNPLHPEP